MGFWYNAAMRRANRVDANQGDIVKALRDSGAYVRVINQGDGLPDLLVGYRGITLLLEVKDGRKPPSQRTLTPLEAEFFKEWPGGILAVVKSPEDALKELSKSVGIEGRGSRPVLAKN